MSTPKSPDSPAVPAFRNFNKPSAVNSKVFRILPLEPAEGSAVNIKILHRNSGVPMIVDRADIPELIADLQAAYGL